MHQIEFDVSEAVPVDDACVIEGDLFMPDELPERPTVVVAMPGGTYNRRYWDLQPPGRSGYSQARYFAENGIVFLAVDYLSGGERNRPAAGELLTLEVVADAAHAVFEKARDGLRAGSFGRTIEGARFVGFAQSFGGNVLIEQQARYGDYEAIALLGTPVRSHGNVLAFEDGWEALDLAGRRAAVLAAIDAAMGPLPVYHTGPRDRLHEMLFASLVDEDLITYDIENTQTLIARTAGVDSAMPGYCEQLAAQITCPIFLGFGEFEVMPAPREEVGAYVSSRDIATVVMDGMPHMHNFADNRAEFWRRQLNWLDYIEPNPAEAVQ